MIQETDQSRSAISGETQEIPFNLGKQLLSPEVQTNSHVQQTKVERSYQQKEPHVGGYVSQPSRSMENLPKSPRNGYYNDFQKSKNCILYVRGFSSEFTEEQFQELFSRFPGLLHVSIRHEENPPYESKRFGFLYYDSEKAAKDVIRRSVAENLLTDEGKQLFISIAEAKDEREKALHDIYQRGRKESEGTVQVPGQTNFRTFLGRKICETSSNHEALKLIEKAKNLSDDQLKAIIQDKQIFSEWKTRILDE